MLLNPRVAALRVHQGKVVGPGDWPALLDVDTFHGLAAFLGDPSRASGSTFERKHQGSGIYRRAVRRRSRPVGLMADISGHPQAFKCVRTRRGAEPQVPMRCSTPKLPEPHPIEAVSPKPRASGARRVSA